MTIGELRDLVITILIAVILFYAFLPVMASLGIITLGSFVFSCALSFYKGVAFKEPRIIGFIAIGHVLTHAAVNQVLPLVWENIAAGLFLEALIIGTVFIMMYLRGKEIQSGSV